MYRERKQLIQSLDLLVFSLFVYVWFIDGKTVWLLVRSALQVQFCNPVQMHPTWSLPFFAVFLSSFNLLMVLLHLFGGPVGAGKSRAIIIDFIGQSHTTSKLHMILIDLLIAFVQVVMLVVAYEHGKDEARPDDERSRLDEDDDEVDGGIDPELCGQGWNADDEESSLFTSHDTDSIKPEAAPMSSAAPTPRETPSALTHPIAVVRLSDLATEIWHGKLGQKSDDEDAPTAASPRPNPDAVAASEATGSQRPDTGRLRRFSRRARPTAEGAEGADATAAQERRPSTMVLNEDWPPMWLVIARNLVGGESSLGTRIAAPRLALANGWQRLTAPFRRSNEARPRNGAEPNRPTARYQRLATEE